MPAIPGNPNNDARKYTRMIFRKKSTSNTTLNLIHCTIAIEKVSAWNRKRQRITALHKLENDHHIVPQHQAAKT